MPTTIKLKRGTLERWNLVNPVLANGEPGVCYDGDNITMKVGDGTRTWLELPTQTYTRDQLNTIINQETSGITSAVISKISFGNIPDSTDNTYPPTMQSTLNHNRRMRYYPDLSQRYNTDYKDFLCTVKWSDGTEGVTDQKYDSWNDLGNYIINNAPNDGNSRTATYSIESLAKQTDDIPKINKIYGMNKFFSILKGKGNYKQRIGHMGAVYDDLSYSNKAQFIAAVWSHFYPGLVDTGNAASFASCTWIASNYHTMYGLMKSGNTIMFTQPDAKGRDNWNWGDSSIHNHTNETMTVDSSVLVGLYPSGSASFEVFDTVNDKVYNSNNSYVRVYKMIGKDQFNDDIVSLYIKPVGVDTFRLNYVPNADNLDLFIYAYDGWGDDQPRVRKVSNTYWNTSEANQMMSDISYLVYKEQWMWTTMSSTTQKHIGETKQKKFRFFLSDGNGNISTFSPEVYPYTHRTGAKSRTKINGT